ncbi:MAG: hypothetical protein HKL91_02155 [Candidatus Eremiobacteraeota bacterium]|uniref:Uncharacterized protein n=1 Tax=mine drainage metagenome TaxID=410659 RepID=E6PEX1_9ZZZZ|nr:hypothetical protein [Candidatus Eremiobacteraeota bacterium]
MIAKGIVALALAATTGMAAPSPSPSPAQIAPPVLPPLKVIVRVKATTPCTQMAVHANAAILLAIRNDATLQQTIARLRAVRLSDGNVLHREQGLTSLFNIAGRLLRNARDADRETGKVLNFAKSVKDPKEKADLVAFVHALGGAVGRQRKVARDLDGFVTTLNAYDMMRVNNTEAGMQHYTTGYYSVPSIPDPTEIQTAPAPDRDWVAMYSGRYPAYWNGQESPSEQTGLSDTQLAHRAASDFQRRLLAIAGDESSAAQPILRAAEHC